MATAKKATPAKTVKAPFPVPAPKGATKAAAAPAKPAAKAAAPAKAAPVKAVKPIKVGDKVKVTRRNGEEVSGKVTGVQDKPNGRWVTVNTSTNKKVSALVTARVSQVVRA